MKFTKTNTLNEFEGEDYKGTDAYYNKNIQRLLQSEYVIFLTYKFVKYKYLRFIRNNLLSYFKKYNVVYLHYYDKQEILNRIDMFNNDIKLKTDDEKEELAKENKIKKIKMIYFLEHVIEPNTLYKKISFSQEELFMSFDNYLIKKMEYKLRTFCQIAEKLGAEEIKIKYDSHHDKKSTINADFSIPGGAGVGGSVSEEKTNDNKVDLLFKYSNYQHNLNLNKYYLIELVDNENDFFISKEEFHSDIDLKFLIDARCLNLIELYNTKIIINRTNQLEKKLFLKAQSYGLTLGTLTTSNDSISLNISIKFIDIYTKTDSINGANVFAYKQGFWHLINIIKQETLNIYNELPIPDTEKKEKEIKIYGKINNYLESQLIGLEKKQYNIESIYNKEQDLIKTYNDVIKLNYITQDNINELFYNYFNNNLVYTHYKIFRDIIIGAYKNVKHMIFKKENNNINKLCFISIQYHKILHCNHQVYDNITKYTTRIYNKLIDSTNIKHFILNDPNFKHLIKNKIRHDDILMLFNNNKTNIINIITNAFEKSYMIYYAIRSHPYNTILHDVKLIIDDNFNNKFSDIIDNLDKIIKSFEYSCNQLNEDLIYNKLRIETKNKQNNDKQNNDKKKQKNNNIFCCVNKTHTKINKFTKKPYYVNDVIKHYIIPNTIIELQDTELQVIELLDTSELSDTPNDLQLNSTEYSSTSDSTEYSSTSDSTSNSSTSDSTSNSNYINSKLNYKDNKHNKNISPIILYYIIEIIIKAVSKNLTIDYYSNYPGYVLNTISNLVCKYFCIKYDKLTILKSNFFKTQNEFQTIEDLSNKIKTIISEQKCRLNYTQTKIFFTWENFLQIIDDIKTKYMSDPTKMNDDNPTLKITDSQYKYHPSPVSPKKSPRKSPRKSITNITTNLDNNNKDSEVLSNTLITHRSSFYDI